VLGAREGGETRRAAQARGGAGEYHCPTTPAGHAPRHGLARQEAGKAGHFPDLGILARALVEDAARHVGADVEDEHIDVADPLLDVRDQRLDFVLLARVGTEAMCLATPRADRIDERLQLVGAAARDAGHVTLARKAARDGAAGGIAGAHDQCHRPSSPLFLRHGAPVNA